MFHGTRIVKWNTAEKMYKAGATVWFGGEGERLNGVQHLGMPINVRGDGEFRAEMQRFRKTVKVAGAFTIRVKV